MIYLHLSKWVAVYWFESLVIERSEVLSKYLPKLLTSTMFLVCASWFRETDQVISETFASQLICCSCILVVSLCTVWSELVMSISVVKLLLSRGQKLLKEEGEKRGGWGWKAFFVSYYMGILVGENQQGFSRERDVLWLPTLNWIS